MKQILRFILATLLVANIGYGGWLAYKCLFINPLLSLLPLLAVLLGVWGLLGDLLHLNQSK